MLLGHVSVQTTERYLGCKQKLRNAVNDGIDLTGLRSSKPTSGYLPSGASSIHNSNGETYDVPDCLVDPLAIRVLTWTNDRPMPAREQAPNTWYVETGLATMEILSPDKP